MYTNSTIFDDFHAYTPATTSTAEITGLGNVLRHKIFVEQNIGLLIIFFAVIAYFIFVKIAQIFYYGMKKYFARTALEAAKMEARGEGRTLQ
jgi:hypothetical protein